jgi:hypothetical protein
MPSQASHSITTKRKRNHQDTAKVFKVSCSDDGRPKDGKTSRNTLSQERHLINLVLSG